MNFFAEDEDNLVREVGFKVRIIELIRGRAINIIFEADNLVAGLFELFEVGNYIIR